VLSSKGTLPATARMLRSATAFPVWIVCAEAARSPDRAELERLGVTFVPVAAGRDGRPDIRAVTSALAERGVTRLLVEGGPTLAAAFLNADLVDEALIYRGAGRASGAVINPFGGSGLPALTDQDTLRPYAERLIGPDRLSVYRRSEFW
jgi:diaminohydroxyphosphoribosylaminopyrimidine deaminase / 5-amino-6-(5-phosphoribosylamino)uracil reductase